MRFFYPALVASLAVVVSGIAIDTSKLTLADLEDVNEVFIEEQCRGAMKWAKEGFYRSGSTVRFHGHLWQCTHWNRGENPESSDVWRDLGECDPDAQLEAQKTLGKRSTSNIQALDDDDEDTTCIGIIDWSPGATFRSGSTVHYGDHLWQTYKWVKGEEPGKSSAWTIVATCPTSKPKLMAKRDECAGLRIYNEESLYRSGGTVRFGKHKTNTEQIVAWSAHYVIITEDGMYQAKKWIKGKVPTDTEYWTFVKSC
ncbi:hypothetical protein FRC10_006377 [Ceratobasidium sp. 414]|nr:hypothetical protein FRC10_006377 [Ceratobasidium sp. 414]